jgi:hypothetical protein
MTTMVSSLTAQPDKSPGPNMMHCLQDVTEKKVNFWNVVVNESPLMASRTSTWRQGLSRVRRSRAPQTHIAGTNRAGVRGHARDGRVAHEVSRDVDWGSLLRLEADHHVGRVHEVDPRDFDESPARNRSNRG